MNLKDTYNRIARDWYKDHNNDDWWAQGTDKFVSLFERGSLVLDVGCGAGVKSKYLADRGLNVTGIDFSENLIDIARENVPSVGFHVMDMKDVLDLKQQFDGVFAQASLLHIPKKEIVDVIGKLISVLKPNGYLYIAVKAIKQDGKEEGILHEDDYGYPYERFFSYFSMDELEKYMKDFNMKVVYRNSSSFGKTIWLQIISHPNLAK